MRNRLLLATLVGVLFAAPANAAFINVTDVNATMITIAFGDFEGGFSIDGIAQGSAGSATFTDGVTHAFTGSFNQNPPPTPAGFNLLFALPGSPTAVTSFLQLTNPGLGNVAGSFGGFTGATFFTTAMATQLQGTTNGGSVTNLTSQMISEQVVPEPVTLSLFGLSLLGFGYRIRRRGAEA